MKGGTPRNDPKEMPIPTVLAPSTIQNEEPFICTYLYLVILHDYHYIYTVYRLTLSGPTNYREQQVTCVCELNSNWTDWDLRQFASRISRPFAWYLISTLIHNIFILLIHPYMFNTIYKYTYTHRYIHIYIYIYIYIYTHTHTVI